MKLIMGEKSVTEYFETLHHGNRAPQVHSFGASVLLFVCDELYHSTSQGNVIPQQRYGLHSQTGLLCCGNSLTRIPAS